MKVIGNVVILSFMIALAVLIGLGQDSISTGTRYQNEEMPPLIFQPSDNAITQARITGAEAFKLLPVGMTHPATKWFNDGIRALDGNFCSRIDFGGGKYEYIKRLYSLPNINLSILRGEFNLDGPWGYGFFTDLGERDLRDIDSTSPEAEYFMTYKTTKPLADFTAEDKRLTTLTFDNPLVTKNVPVKAGHTYLLRSIIYNRSDLAGALNVIEVSPDGSVTMLWKKLAGFEVTRRP